MAEDATKHPVRNPVTGDRPVPSRWSPFESLQREINHLIEDFDRGYWRSPFRRSLLDVEPFRKIESMWSSPATDIVEKDKAFEVTAEVPGMDADKIEVKLANGRLTIKGEKKEQKEERKTDSYFSERHYGAFERSFQVPEGVDTAKIEAKLEKGLLTIILPKTAEAQKPEKKITVKAA